MEIEVLGLDNNLANKSVGIGAKPALIVVDLIRGFTDPECELGHECSAVVTANQQLLKHFRMQQRPVVFTTVVYREPQRASVFRAKLPALNVLSPDSKWVQVDPRAERQIDEPIIEKQWASAFFNTKLAELLNDLKVDSLVVTGLTTSGCVRATAVDGLQHNYPVTVVADAVGDRNKEAHKANLFDLQAKYTDVKSVEEITRTLQ